MDSVGSLDRFAVRLLPVPEGLYVVRYVSSADTRQPPRILVQARPDTAGDLLLVPAPGVADGMLRPGDCLVVAARRAGALMITTWSEVTAVSDDVNLKVERLDAGRTAPAAAPPPPLPDAVWTTVAVPEPAPGGLVMGLSGHVQAAGDIAAGPDGWLGGPQSRRWIEGLSVAWPTPIPGVKLAYSAAVRGRARTRPMAAGQYAGTRRQATPLVGFTLELGGPRAAEHELVVGAAFLGCDPVERTGRRVELAGPGGDEPLTGLRVEVRPVQAAAAAAEAGATAGPAPAQGPLRGRVRVFRPAARPAA